MTMDVTPEKRHEALCAGFANFEVGAVDSDGCSIGYRHAGHGPAVLLLHGFPQTGREWSTVAADLAADFHVFVVDNRGVGGSTGGADGYDKASLARDAHTVLAANGVESANVVGHDLGGMIAVAYARQFPHAVETLTVIDCLIPGTETFRQAVASGGVWLFGFHGETDLAVGLIGGREADYFGRLFDGHAVNKMALNEPDKAFYVDVARSGDGLRNALRLYATFEKDAAENASWFEANGPLHIPTLAVGGDGALGSLTSAQATELSSRGRAWTVENCGHWVPEEQPRALANALRDHFRQDKPDPN